MRALLFLCGSLLYGMVSSQSVLFMEDFEGASSDFTLNTTDVASVAAGSNAWVVNNAYAGGSGTLVCLGFPFSFTVPNTPAQPVGITSANGKYLHMISNDAVNSGIQCCSYLAADGLCTPAANHFVRMDTDVSTIGATSVELSFWWLCAGGNTIYGEVYYSTDGGANWNLITTPIAQYRNASIWTQQMVSLPAFTGLNALRFGFRFVNGQSGLGGQDPGFAIDDVSIRSYQGTNSIATQPWLPTYCAGPSSVPVSYVATGTFSPGNTFTAQLSDAVGSFTNPVAIGSVVSSTSGSVNVIIPSNTPYGTGYRIRVVSDMPAVVGTDNGANIVLAVAPNAGTNGFLTLCSNSAPVSLFPYLGGSPDPNGSWTDPFGNPITSLDPDTATSGCYTYTVAGQGSCADATATVCVQIHTAPDAGTNFIDTVCINGSSVAMFTLLGGTPSAGGTWTGPGGASHNGMFIFGVDPLGCYTYTVLGIPPCANASSVVCVLGVLPAADAGLDANSIICSNGGMVDLFDELGGTPDPGGTWTTPGGMTFTGILDPTVHGPGPYTYTVAGIAPCPDDMAVVDVFLDPCQSIATDQ